MRALLFDIDGTLTRSAGAGSRALGRALHASPRAREELRRMRLDGMTDRIIARALLAAEGDHSIPVEERAKAVPDAQIDAVLGKYIEALAEECAEGGYVALPGALELIAAVESRDGVLVGICTGNLERGAQLKLQSARFRAASFKFGGYGSDAEHRPDVVRAAWKRAQALGATEGLVIGDTPRDISAAHDAGLPACGVATGRYDVHELSLNGADAVLAGFTDLDATVRLLLGPVPR